MTQLDIYFVLQPNGPLPKKPKIDVRPAAKTLNSLLVNVGHSWFKALESEFSKQYFNDVSAFHPS